MMMDEWDKFLAPLGLKLLNCVVAAFASFTALNFWKGLETRKERWTTFMGGWAIAAWGAAPLREALEAKPSVEVLLVLVMGLFGMALAAEVVKLIRDTDWRGQWQQLVDAVGRRISGNGK